ncbi:MAG: hypothetical protein PGN25_12295 [Methylorubrum populi]
MIALAVLAAAVANVTLVVLLADRFGNEGGVHASAGELTSLAATGRPAAPKAGFTLANENALAAAKAAA